ncbi:MAG: cell envelope integrity EipB family protein [Hyphomicrobiaceae bacterium]|nr:cell envelope integrity EipB family protein [Hyphomicrobiaceae bacterium]
MNLKKTILKPVLLGTLAICACGDPSFALAPGSATNLVPHRAVYEMTLDQSRPATGVSGVRGRMVFEFAGSGCDGFTMNMRLVTRIVGETGRSSTTDLRSSTWEEGRGKRFRFNSSQYRGEKLEETTSGDAEREAAESDVDVHVNAPKPKEIKVSGPVLFPTQHSIAILEAAKRGKSILQARVYDGSGKGDKVYSTTAFIGKPVKPGAKQPENRVKNDEALEKLSSWPVSISYFDSEEDGETPVYQLGFRFYENGISRDLVIDYGDFAIKGNLSSLELMPSHGCE